MDWSAIAGIVAPIAPKLGGLLGGAAFGPLGGIAGTIAGNALAGALGVAPTPAAVGNAIQADPAAQAKIEKLEAEHADALVQQAQVQITALTQAGETARTDVTEINTTQRAELGVVSWWHWRHLLGYVVGFEILVFPTAALAMIMVGSAEKTQAIINFSGTLVTILTIGAGLLGWVASDTTQQKIVAATGTPASTTTDTVLGTVRSLAAKVTGKR